MLSLLPTLDIASCVGATVLPNLIDSRNEPQYGALHGSFPPLLVSIFFTLNSRKSDNHNRVCNVSSFEPVPGKVCWLYSSKNCSDICRSSQGCNCIVEFPGHANLSAYGYPAWMDRVGSFTCGPTKTFYE
ncbi:uncharacterized protein RAG0_01579 [Rhynchosporium agropyri]|uniref:Uncharacterized protein n=1 Tax=Rhynchosporium agropyri TaxID=914238 RepID=A0A1E1JXC3_9HELO|nr:uncharacterized protein RAG0_01579 [Rhynchosporium agropyri]